MTYVDDVVNAWVLAIEAPADRVVGQKFQVSYGTEKSVTELAYMCRDAIGTEVPLEFVDYRPGEKGQREAFSTEKARSVLGYRPKVPPAEAISHTAAWIKSIAE